MPTTTINHQLYYYEQHGAGPDLVLLHGFTGSVQNWRRTHIEALEARFRITVIDILGHGRSASPPDPSRYHMDAVSGDVLAICDALKIEQFHLLGYSMGGRLALYTAVHHSHRLHSLILESNSPGLATAAEREARQTRDNELADWIEANGIEAFVDRWEKLALWDSQKQLPQEVLDALRQQRLQNNVQGLANSLRGMGTGVQPSLWDKLPTLTLPVLQIVGQLDQKFVGINEQMAALLPNTRLEIMPQAGHTVHLERPLYFNVAVVPFLERL